LPSKEELEREQIRLTNEKLKIETNKLQQDAKPERWWSRLFKNAIAFGGIVTVAATAYGIWDSYDKTIADREHTRLADERTRFEDAVKRLESSSTISKLVGVSVLSNYLVASNKDLESSSMISKLVGVSVLSGYLVASNKDKEAHNKNKEAQRQVLFTLAGLMATEKDPQIQAAVIDLMNSIPKDGPISLSDWRYFQDMLVTQSRALMDKGDLWRHRQFQSASPLTDDERAARTVGKLIASNIRKGVVPDYPNYRGIYCEECDFHGVAFPYGIDFTGAVLDRSNFSNARLEAAVFDNAELQGTKFVEADLRQAKFRSLDESLMNGGGGDSDRVLFGRTRYLDHIASALDINATVDVRMPNFSCANLADANFDRHSLFPGVILLQRSYAKSDQDKSGWYQNVPAFLKDEAKTRPTVNFPVARISPPKFLKANIAGAHFERARFFTFTATDDFPDYMSSSSGVRLADIMVVQGNMHDEAFQLEGEKNKGGRETSVPIEVSRFQRRLKAAFYSVELDRASLPENVADFLKKSVPEKRDFLSIFRTPEGADPDLGCTPRL
jgi:uncharacterized protein YjbI with pentapeptide repeats